MTITALDPNPALVVIDLQAGTAGNPQNPTAHPIDGVVAAAANLATAFRERGLPVVLANVDGMPGGRTQYGEGARAFPAEFSALLPSLAQQPSDLIVTRSTWSAFAGTDLDATLRRLCVTQVVLAGMATSFGVESTARQAYDLGYSVVFALDAITDRVIESHDGSVQRAFLALGQAATAADVVALLPA
ncbi:isochorismatase family protein [Agreia sp. PsM10]|uniref:cysteine hydrolase family protein n=1 Tax=Agreia sp. PsM10 TaxID=3030533 RepID=UPI00263B9DCB|nr:isochorismatase family protein [Agreia sp. PsM10]MDN4639942.1 isochorismatase family protein [Agreia sp. PsM10]